MEAYATADVPHVTNAVKHAVYPVKMVISPVTPFTGSVLFGAISITFKHSGN